MLLVAPHAGSEALEGSTPRREVDSSDPHFSLSRDLVTAELTLQLASHFPENTKPSILISRIHRKFADLNRPASQGTHDPTAKAFHRRFHKCLEEEIARLKSEFGWVLLIDIHGQGSLPVDLIVGTRRARTIGPWSKSLLWGPSGILGELKELGISTEPTRPRQKFRYGGGHIVRHYGQDPELEAWQFEHGRELRFDQARNKSYTKCLGHRLLTEVVQRGKLSTKRVLPP